MCQVNVFGHKHVWAQPCGHSRVGTITYWHKCGGTFEYTSGNTGNIRLCEQQFRFYFLPQIYQMNIFL